MDVYEVIMDLVKQGYGVEEIKGAVDKAAGEIQILSREAVIAELRHAVIEAYKEYFLALGLISADEYEKDPTLENLISSELISFEKELIEFNKATKNYVKTKGNSDISKLFKKLMAL